MIEANRFQNRLIVLSTLCPKKGSSTLLIVT